MKWKDENGNTCFGINPNDVETVADASENSESGAVETPPRKRKSKEADENE